MPESSVEKAKQVCNKLCETIRKRTEDSGISCSMGIAIFLPENDYDANSLVKQADAAMYEAKKEPGLTIKLAKV
ncbi:diguanylate cyclase domain-containing protein [Desulfopila sp. IMCC35008]|uniref:diguanylate cyclase domain-containing protein n=1 Tax=Desulfopila sp. IMCC35008 TaxID=2653858 RepID=UPI0035147806